MQYAILFYETDKEFATRDHTEEGAAYWGPWRSYIDENIAPAASCARRRAAPPRYPRRDHHPARGRPQACPGRSLAAAKEQLAGFFLIEVPDIDAALAWAAKAPCAPIGVEVRPTLPGM